MLFQNEIQVGTITLRNRIVMPPMATGKAPDGVPTDEIITYYKERARGTGLIIVEHAYILPEGMAHANQLSMATDEVIPAYQKLTDAVHSEGAKIFAQINHAGAKAKDTGLPAKAPSAVSVRDSEIPTEMRSADIAEVVEAFVAAARRVKASGFDGVEIHSAHGYLLNQFYSPLANKRTDDYSVTPMGNRIRLHGEVIRAVREEVGADFPVAIRLGGCDYLENGSEVADVPQAVKAFEQTGADLIDMTGGLQGFVRPEHTEPGYFRELSEAAKSAVSVPVILTGGVTTAEEMEQLLAEGAADLIGVGRPMLKDGQWSANALGL